MVAHLNYTDTFHFPNEETKNNGSPEELESTKKSLSKFSCIRKWRKCQLMFDNAHK